MLSGVLFKQGDTLLQWNSRYFELCGDCLIYWTTEQQYLANKRPRGIIPIDSHCSITRSKHAGKHAVLIKRTGKSDLWLGADDANVADLWTNNIAQILENVRTENRLVGESENSVLERLSGAKSPREVFRNTFSKDSAQGKIVREAEDDSWTLVKVEESGISVWKKNSEEDNSKELEQIEKLICVWAVIYFTCHCIVGIWSLFALIFSMFAFNFYHPNSFRFLPNLSVKIPKNPTMSFSAVLLMLLFLIDSQFGFLGIHLACAMFILLNYDPAFYKTFWENKVSMKLSFSVDCDSKVLFGLLMDIPSRYKWDPRLVRVKQQNSSEFKRSLKLEYLSKIPYLKKVYEIMVEEEWYDVSPSSKVLHLKSKNSAPFSNLSLIISPLDSNFAEKSTVSVLFKRSDSIIARFIEKDYTDSETFRGICAFIQRTSSNALKSISERSLITSISFQTRDEASLSAEREFRSKLDDCKNFLTAEHLNAPSYLIVKEFKGVRIERKRDASESGKLTFKSSIVVEKPIEYLLLLARDPTIYESLNPFCESSKILEQLSSISKIIHLKVSKTGIIPSRDDVLAMSLFSIENGSFCLAMKSVDHSNAPVNSNVSRQSFDHLGYIFEKLDGGLSTLVSFYCKRSIPNEPSIPKNSEFWNSFLVIHAFELCNLKAYCKEQDNTDYQQDIRPYLEAIYECDGASGFLKAPLNLHSEKRPVTENQTLSVAESQKFLKAIKEALELAYSQVLDLSSWEYVQEKKGVKVYKMPPTTGLIPIVMGISQIKAPLKVALAIIDDLSIRAKLDPMLNKASLYQYIDPVTQLGHLLFHGIWPVAARDFCNVSSYRIFPNGSVIYGGTSVQYSGCPETKGVVRGNITFGAYVLFPKSENTCELRYIVNTDLGGSIPNFVVQQVAMDQPMIAAAVRDYAENLKQSNYNFEELHNRWASFNHDESKQKDESSPAEVIAPLEKLEMSPKLESAALLLEYQVYAKDAILTLERIFSPKTQWIQLSPKNGIEFSVCQFGGSSKLYRGRIMLPVTPHQLLSLFTPTSRLLWYDEQIISIESLVKIGNSTNISALKFDAREICNIDPLREFVLLDTNSARPNGSILLAFKSVPCPVGHTKPTRGHGTIDTFGFMFEPVSTGTSTVTRVSLVWQLDPTLLHVSSTLSKRAVEWIDRHPLAILSSLCNKLFV